MKKFLITILLVGCGTKSINDEVSHSLSRTEVLSQRVAAVKADMTFPGDQLWQDPEDCDYTLWAGEAKAAGLPVNLDAVEYAPGKIERRPVRTCFDGQDRGAVSSVSNDMLTGYMIGRYESGDLAALQRLADYGAEHAYFMGMPLTAVGEVFMKTPLQALLGKMIYALSDGSDDRRIRHSPATYFHVSADYAQHVQAVQILWHGEADADLAFRGLDNPKPLPAIPDGMLDRLKDSARENPENYFFATALAVYDGSYEHALDLLLSDNLQIPSYVRGGSGRVDIFQRVHWLLSAKIVLRHYKAEG